MKTNKNARWYDSANRNRGVTLTPKGERRRRSPGEGSRNGRQCLTRILKDEFFLFFKSPKWVEEARKAGHSTKRQWIERRPCSKQHSQLKEMHTD